MNLNGVGFHILGVFKPFAGSRCVEYLLPYARDCRVSWAVMARWGTPICLEVGVSYLMSALTLPHGWLCFACRVLPITFFFFFFW